MYRIRLFFETSDETRKTPLKVVKIYCFKLGSKPLILTPKSDIPFPERSDPIIDYFCSPGFKQPEYNSLAQILIKNEVNNSPWNALRAFR